MKEKVPYHDWFDWGNLWKLEIKNIALTDKDLKKTKEDLEFVKELILIEKLKKFYSEILIILDDYQLARIENEEVIFQHKNINKESLLKLSEFKERLFNFYKTDLDKVNITSNLLLEDIAQIFKFIITVLSQFEKSKK